MKNGTVFIRLEDLLHCPIGKHLYSIDINEFLESIISLCDSVIVYMQKNNIDRVDTGTLNDFKRVKGDIEAYLNLGNPK